MAAAETAFRYAFALLEAEDQASDDTEDEWITALIAEWANTADSRLMVAAGACELSSALTGRVHRRPAAWVIAARCAKVPISEDLGRVASGAVTGVSSLYHDENSKPGLDDERFATLRTIIGRSGFYITAGRMMAAEGSDFGLVQRRRVMDRACKVARNAYLNFLNEEVIIDDDGLIDEVSAAAIENYVTGQLEADLINGSKRHASAVSSTLDRAQNVLSTESLKTKVTLRPLAYARDIEVEIGFVNPALAAASE
jgi:hypothetical protein